MIARRQDRSGALVDRSPRHPLPRTRASLSRSCPAGNQQKVAVARLLHHDVDVLLLDEPTRGIDVGSKAQMYELLDRLVSEATVPRTRCCSSAATFRSCSACATASP